MVHGQFQANYGRPLLVVRDAKCSTKEVGFKVVVIKTFSPKTKDKIEAILQWKTKEKPTC
jgi:hypothetical protein